ncbi:hypothetical protein [Pseudonocardia spirodelae]|uniref:Uncharacterized protein n=1 Tax=Pseudonocardia spirodelae TaxID=3133431 RepID=A0ABU8T373_9PSEU
MSAPHADDRTPARPQDRRNGHHASLLDGLPPGRTAPDDAPRDAARPTPGGPVDRSGGPRGDGGDSGIGSSDVGSVGTAASGRTASAPGEVPAPRGGSDQRPGESGQRPAETTAADCGPAPSATAPSATTPPGSAPTTPAPTAPAPTGTESTAPAPTGAAPTGTSGGHGPAPAPGTGEAPAVPAPGAVELTGPVDALHRTGPRTPPLPWNAVPPAARAGSPVPPAAPLPRSGAPVARTGTPGAPPPAGAPHRPGPPRAPHPGVPAQRTGPGWPPPPSPAGPGGRGNHGAPVPAVFPPGHPSSPAGQDRWAALRGRVPSAAALSDGLRGAVPHRAAAVAVVLTLVLAAAVVVAAYAGTGPAARDTTEGAGTATIAPVAAPADLVRGTTAADPAAFGSPVTFTSPTGNIACRIEGGEARCDVTDRAWSADGCDAPGLVTGGTGPARTACDGTPVGGGAAALGYGTHLTDGDLTCVSLRTGIECRDARSGHGFTAARAAFRVY